MDTLTHIVLGACIGEALAGKNLGKKALFVGAVAQSIPDIDFVASFWLPTTADLLAHRGFTHSFLFILLAAPLLAFLSRALFRGSGYPFNKWVLFWGLQIFIHIFIDAFNAYGTGWFEPFSHYRVSFNTMFVADPLFSIWPAIAFAMLLIIKTTSNRRKLWVKISLAASSMYLLLGICFKIFTDHKITNNLQERHIAYNRFFTTPTPLNNLLWYVVAENDSGYYTGYSSVLDKQHTIGLRYVSRNDSLLKLTNNITDLHNLLRFSEGYYTAELSNDTLVFNILRFGEIAGWYEKNPRFVFYYYLQHPEANALVVQRGRFAKWDKHSLHLFLERIEGN